MKRGSKGDPAAKVKAGIYALVAFLIALAAAATVVGLHDARAAGASLGATALSAVLIAFGIALAVGAYQLAELGRSRWEGGIRPPCKPPVLIAFLLTALAGLVLFFSAIGARASQWPLVVVVALVLVAVGVGGLRLFRGDVKITVARVGGAIALGILGTAIGLWQFWYQNQYVPARAGRAVALKGSLQLAGEQGGHHVVRATVEYEDIGGRSVSVIGSTYTLTGSRVVRCHRFATFRRVKQYFEKLNLDPQRSRFMADVVEQQPVTVLAAGKFVGDGKRLEPNVPSRRDLVFLVPRGRYQLLRFRAQLFAIPGSVRISRRTNPEYRSLPGGRFMYGFWHVDDNSWLRDLVSGRERWVVLRYQLVDPDARNATATSPDLRVTARFPKPTWSGRPSDARVRRLFDEAAPDDASEPFADSELALEDVARPTVGEKLPKGCRRG